MKHDHECELRLTFTYAYPCPGCRGIGRHCHCGSRAWPLCEGCRAGQHLNHAPAAADTDQPCSCDLCQEVAA